jgi:hypothetical protein
LGFWLVSGDGWSVMVEEMVEKMEERLSEMEETSGRGHRKE